MSVQGISAADGGYYGYYGLYENPKLEKAQVSFNGKQQEVAQSPKKKQKTGFWEGVGALCKGFFVNTIADMIKHPIATLAGIAVATALAVGTGGAAVPFLLAAGIGLGAWKVGKGTVNAIMADSREETLKALEEAGEGAFAIAASAIGAKNYAAGLKSAASTTSATAGEAATATTATAGEAAATAAKPSMFARAGAYLGEVKTGVVETVKAVPNSYRTSVKMLKSGEVYANLKSAVGSAKLAWQQKQLEKLNGISDENIIAKTARDKYEINSHIFNNKVDAASVKLQRKYLNEWKDLWAKGQLDTEYGKMITRLAFENRKLVNLPNWTSVKNGLNPKLHIPESIAAVVTAGNFNGDSDEYIPNEPQEQMPYYYPYYQGYSYCA